MENVDEYCTEQNNNAQLLSLPEEIIREIFSHLSFETLQFSLRKVCRKMKYFVESYANVGGLFILLSKRNRNCQDNQLIDVIQTSNKAFKINWKNIPCTPDESYYQLRGTKRYQSCPSEEYFYFTTGDNIFCLNWHPNKLVLYRYNVLNNNWDLFSENRYIVKCKNIRWQTNPTCKYHPVNLHEGSNYISNYEDFLHFDYRTHNYRNNPFLRLSNDGIKNAPNEETYEAWFCRCYCNFTVISQMTDGIQLRDNYPKELDYLQQCSVLRIGPQRLLFVGGYWIRRIEWTEGQSTEAVHLEEHPDTSQNFINRHVIQVDLNTWGYNISWKSKYIDEMPSRPQPFCFKLKNNLYIAANCKIAWYNYRQNEKERSLMCTNCRGFTSYNNSSNTRKVSKAIYCCCCDKFNLSDEKYYRNVCSLPRPIENLTNLKVTTNKNESLALIDFHDQTDCRDKIWIFAEKEEKFEEHWDPNSEPCVECIEHPLNTSMSYNEYNTYNHRRHSSWKINIMNIQ